MKAADRIALKEWELFAEEIRTSTAVNTSETVAEQKARMARLERDPEAWFKYYFPKFAYAEPADFHKRATRRVLANAEWYEVRAWSRELAKSTRTMMEVLFLAMTGKKRNVLMISNSKDNAVRLLMPFKINLEKNQRIINDYGKQENYGRWSDEEFVTKGGVAFRAIGAGQSPRGTRNEEIRPDVLLFDDLDTDEECRNPDIIQQKWEWVEQAAMATRSISNPMLVIFCGNIIAEDCCITRAIKMADKSDVVNIRDKEGRSSWPQKNTEEHIDRALSMISYESGQKEYFNNPMSSGKTFPEITWGKCPPLSSLPLVVIYADPASSNKDKPTGKKAANNSMKAVVAVGSDGARFYVYNAFLDNMSNSHFIDAAYALYDYCKAAKVRYVYIENNTLQDPFYTQVLMPLVAEIGKSRDVLPVIPDGRAKPDKWFRIEGTLEPINRTGRLIFNEREQSNPNMQRLEAQFKSAKPTSKLLDGPDAVEGAVVVIQGKIVASTTEMKLGRRKAHGKRF
jgi:hypothetical protein